MYKTFESSECDYLVCDPRFLWGTDILLGPSTRMQHLYLISSFRYFLFLPWSPSMIVIMQCKITLSVYIHSWFWWSALQHSWMHRFVVYFFLQSRMHIIWFRISSSIGLLLIFTTFVCEIRNCCIQIRKLYLSTIC